MLRFYINHTTNAIKSRVKRLQMLPSFPSAPPTSIDFSAEDRAWIAARKSEPHAMTEGVKAAHAQGVL